MERPASKQFDTREILWKARRYRWMALLPVVATCCAGFIYLKVAAPVYESNVVVTIVDRTQVSAALEPLVRSDRSPGESIIEKITRVRNRILNRSFLESLAERTGFLSDARLRSDAAAEVKKHPDLTVDELVARYAVTILGRKISVEPSGMSNIRVSVGDRSPVGARDLAAAIANGLIEDTRRSTIDRYVARTGFSEDQITVYTEKLRRSEDALRVYQEGMISRQAVTGPVTAVNVDVVRQLADDADKEIDQVRTRIQSDLATWAARQSGTPMPALESPGAADLASRMSSLEGSYAASALRQAEGNEESQTLLQRIAGVRQQLLSEYDAISAVKFAGILTPIDQQLAAGISLDRSVLRSLQARKSRLSSLLSAYLNQARATPRSQMELERLRTDVAMNRDLLAALQREATSSTLSEALDTSQMSVRIEVVEPPVLPLYPVWPDRLKVAAASLGTGIFFAVVLILGLERVGSILRTVEQAEKELGVKVIGMIPKIEGWAKPGSFLQNNWAPLSIVTLILVTVLVAGVHSAIVARDVPPPPAAPASR